MFPTRYYANRYYAPRYFPKVGEDSVVAPVAVAGTAVGGHRRFIDYTSPTGPHKKYALVEIRKRSAGGLRPRKRKKIQVQSWILTILSIGSGFGGWPSA